ncbi:calmodulin [Stylonychia lemnae]|uniref:Calmodulin n=1 Tax=Stylonychia lemnae TaxID=5949 RepID=A0A078AKQ0_STYLE|nr:calmodulin [Stylonychia lemnae]|eukprot:CDW82789.1 calmodulin [Stylonychia lemnae]
MSHNFSEGQRAEFQAAFDFFDKNGDKQISAKELGVVMKNIGQHITEQELNQMILEADEDGSGTIDFDEFLTLMQKRLQELDVKEELIEAFKVYDKEKNGCIAVDEMKKILQKMGESVSKEEIDEVIKDLISEQIISEWKKQHNSSESIKVDPIDLENQIAQVDPLKLGAYGVKKPLDEKSQSIQDLIAASKRYYPMDRMGNIDEWGAIVNQQVDNYQRAQEQKKLQEKQQSQFYGLELQHEKALKEKQKEIERCEKQNDLELANRKKQEYDTMLNGFKNQQYHIKELLAGDYRQNMSIRQNENRSKRMQELSEGKIANMRVQQEMEQIKQMDLAKKQMIKDMYQQDISQRKGNITYDLLMRDQQKLDAQKLMAENSQVSLDAQRLYKQRYDSMQDQQKQINDNYLSTVKAPEIERRIEEQEKIQKQNEMLRNQAKMTEEMKQQLQRDFAQNNRQILVKQLEDREKLKYLGKEMKHIELEESETKVHDHKNFEELKQKVNKQRQLTYKEMLDNQINSKEINFTERPETKDKREKSLQENLKRLDKYGYNRDYASLINTGNQTARGAKDPIIFQGDSTDNVKYNLTGALDTNQLRKSAILDIGMKNMQSNILGDRGSFNASLKLYRFRESQLEHKLGVHNRSRHLKNLKYTNPSLGLDSDVTFQNYSRNYNKNQLIDRVRKSLESIENEKQDTNLTAPSQEIFHSDDQNLMNITMMNPKEQQIPQDDKKIVKIQKRQNIAKTIRLTLNPLPQQTQNSHTSINIRSPTHQMSGAYSTSINYNTNSLNYNTGSHIPTHHSVANNMHNNQFNKSDLNQDLVHVTQDDDNNSKKRVNKGIQNDGPSTLMNWTLSSSFKLPFIQRKALDSPSTNKNPYKLNTYREIQNRQPSLLLKERSLSKNGSPISNIQGVQIQLKSIKLFMDQDITKKSNKTNKQNRKQQQAKNQLQIQQQKQQFQIEIKQQSQNQPTFPPELSSAQITQNRNFRASKTNLASVDSNKLKRQFFQLAMISSNHNNKLKDLGRHSLIITQKRKSPKLRQSMDQPYFYQNNKNKFNLESIYDTNGNSSKNKKQDKNKQLQQFNPSQPKQQLEDDHMQVAPWLQQSEMRLFSGQRTNSRIFKHDELSASGNTQGLKSKQKMKGLGQSFDSNGTPEAYDSYIFQPSIRISRLIYSAQQH